jgi:hypothetical protein
MDKPAWQFEYSVECGASRQFAWDYWTNVANWADPPAEFQLDGPFKPGAHLTTKVPGQPPWESVIEEVVPGCEATIEMRLVGAALRFHWRFETVTAERTKITQRLTLNGAKAKEFIKPVSILEQTVPDGMKRLGATMALAEAQKRRTLYCESN